MFWDKVACVYDIFADIINKKANQKLCAVVESLMKPTDEVLECACGTGLLSGRIAGKCKSLIATDFSANMLKHARKKYGKYDNLKFEQSDIMHLPYPDAERLSAFPPVSSAPVLAQVLPRLASREISAVHPAF